jgi:hypothetical protein
VHILHRVAGPYSSVLFLEIGTSEWVPVGEEKLSMVVKGKGSKGMNVI